MIGAAAGRFWNWLRRHKIREAEERRDHVDHLRSTLETDREMMAKVKDEADTRTDALEAEIRMWLQSDAPPRASRGSRRQPGRQAQ